MTTTTMRQSTLETLGLNTVLDIFKNSKMPVDAGTLVDKIFGPKGQRGSLVVSGANGVVGAGKVMQLGSRLLEFGIPLVALDFPGTPDGISMQYKGLAASFGPQKAGEIMGNIIRLNYDGKTLPKQLEELSPKFLLEAIPEVLEIKKAHYKLFRKTFPDIIIKSVTSGFPSSELGVDIAHPAFPHQINKIWETVEDKPTEMTQLMWALGLVPIPVSDNWSFVLDVLFCGVTLAGLSYHEAKNTPFWKIDKYVRKYIGPNPFRAHDAIGAKGSNFLTWNCLNDLSKQYGAVFTPTNVLTERKETGQNWYPPNHFRPLVNWKLNSDDEKDFEIRVIGPIIQMTALMLHEKRGHLSHINIIGELCAQFRNGAVAMIRKMGADKAIELVNKYHEFYPEAKQAWHPEALSNMDGNDWKQLYVNAEHDGKVGVISIGRESYNQDVDDELNRAIDWLKEQKINSVIVSGDFHLSTQLVGADTSEFYPALENEKAGFLISNKWSKTARRLNDDFEISVGFVSGKRLMGGCLELFMHCHYLVAPDGSKLGMPEVTLPVVPGMEGCHWPFRKIEPKNWSKLLDLLLTGKTVNASNAQNWLVDYSGSIEDCLKTVWNIATNGDHNIAQRKLNKDSLNIAKEVGDWLAAAENSGVWPEGAAGRKAIGECIAQSCKATLSESLDVQSKQSAAFMKTSYCKKGAIGSDFKKTILV